MLLFGIKIGRLRQVKHNIFWLTLNTNLYVLRFAGMILQKHKLEISNVVILESDIEDVLFIATYVATFALRTQVFLQTSIMKLHLRVIIRQLSQKPSKAFMCLNLINLSKIMH